MKQAISVLLALCLLFLCGCQTQPSVPESTTATEPNPAPTPIKNRELTNFAYHDGVIYFISGFNVYDNYLPIHSYDLATDTLFTNTSGVKVHGMTVSETLWHDGTDLYRVCSGGVDILYRVSPDLSSEEAVWQVDAGSSITGFGICYDENYIFYTEGTYSEAEQTGIWTLYRYDRKTQEKTVVYNDLRSFFYYTIDDQYIYITDLRDYTAENMEVNLLRSPKDTIQLEKIDTPHTPGRRADFADGGAYIDSMSKKDTLMFHSYDDGSVTDTGVQIYGYFHAVGNQKIVSRYTPMYSKTRSTQCKPLYVYDLKTGDSTLLCDSVYEFDVFDNRYVCYWWADWQHHKFFVHDLETGETKLMFEEKESVLLID